MEKPADVRKQWKFSKYSFPGDPPKDFSEEKRAPFQQDGTQVPMGSKPQRTCLELAKVYRASVSCVNVPLPVPARPTGHSASALPARLSP